MAKPATSKTSIDMNKFRLRTFVDKLIDIGEVEIHDEAVPLSELSRIIEATPKAVLFRKAGPEQVELVSSVAGGRRRVAAAFGVPVDSAWKEYLKRLESPQPVIEVTSGDAPVHEVVIQGDDVDLAKLPFHPQHELDGSTYLSSAIDYTIDPETGTTNVKHVFVVDHDIDVSDIRQMDWALSTRFQANRDFVLVEGTPGMRMDPSLEGRPIGGKAGFDCTVPFGRKETVATKVAAAAAVFGGPCRFQTVREAVAAGPIYFVDIMRGLGSEDGREIALELDALRQEGVLCRNGDGQYFLGTSKKGVTTVVAE